MDRRLGRTIAIFVVIMVLGMIALRSRAGRIRDQLPAADTAPQPAASCVASDTASANGAACDTTGSPSQ